MTLLRFQHSGLLLIGFLFLSNIACSKTIWKEFAVEQSTKNEDTNVQKIIDSVFIKQNVFGAVTYKNAVVHQHFFCDKTFDFYVLILLFAFLGIIRLADPNYFFEILQSFKNANLSNRQSKDKVLQKSFSNFLMNLFFIFSASTFCYYFFKQSLGNKTSIENGSLLLHSFLGISVLYLGKYIVIKFSGWAFRVEQLTEQYLFNVFLLNKILGLLLLPAVFLIIFASGAIAHIVLVFSIFLIVSSFILRYFRSWKVFSSFFNFSKFHFFTYICASELIPIAVLVKLLAHGVY